MGQLSITSVIKDAAWETMRHWKHLLHALILPAVVLSLFELAAFRFRNSGQVILLFTIASIPVYVLYAVSCHRIILLGHDSLPNRWGIYWTPRESRFFAWSIGITLLVTFISLALFPVLMAAMKLFPESPIPVIPIVMFVPVGYVISRSSMVFPITALGQKSDLASSWELSKRNGWRLTIALAAPYIFLESLRRCYAFISSNEESALSYFFVALWLLLVSALEVTTLSVAFRKLSDLQDVQPTS